MPGRGPAPAGGWGPGQRGGPPWWPEGHRWPPRGGHPWPGGRRLLRRAGCALAIVTLFLGVVGTAAVWLAASALGLVGSAPLARLLSAGALLAGLLALSAGILAVRRLATPARRLVEAAGQIEAGDYSARVPVRGPAELRSLARAFNAMSGRLESDQAQRRTVVTDVAHELRTPLAIIRGQAEGVADGVYRGGAESMAPIIDAARALEVLVDDLATLALAETGNLRLAREPVDMAVLVNETLAAFRPAADTADIRLVEDVADEVPPVDADPARLRGVLGNLLTNALRHSESGGTVRITVRRDGDRVNIEVRDDGEGIAPDLLERIFERFVKGPGSTGSGLGLAIVRDVIAAHGGTVTAESTPGVGTVVALVLPIADSTRTLRRVDGEGG